MRQIYKHLAGYHPFSFQERSQLPDQEGVLQLFVIQQALGRKFDPAFYGRSHLMDKWINQSGTRLFFNIYMLARQI